MIVSAFDAFIHDITRIGLIEVYNGIRPQSISCTKYPIGLAVLSQINSTTDSTIKLAYWTLISGIIIPKILTKHLKALNMHYL